MIARGLVRSARGGSVEAEICGARVGDGVRLETARGRMYGTVAALRDGVAMIAAHGALEGIRAGDPVWEDPGALTMPLGCALLGRSIDAFGRPLDGRPPARGPRRPVHPQAPPPSERIEIRQPFWTGIRAIDGLLTLGRGTRVGIFGPPGAGKSTLLCALLEAQADAVVVALVGERGREAQEWLQRVHSTMTIVCATGDRSPAERIRAARVAMAQADALRSRGLHVLLILDSLARFGGALRELALARGEPAGRGGFPGGVFAELASFVEIAGTRASGSITMVASVLSDGEERDPLSDAARSILDGHIQLSEQLAHAGRFPAIDVLASASRTMTSVASAAQQADAGRVRRALDSLARSSDARTIGIEPFEPFAMAAIACEDQIEAFLRQSSTRSGPSECLAELALLGDRLGKHNAAP